MRLDFDEGAGFLIDQTPYKADESGFSVKRGTREVWEIKNSPISMPHPMHLHGLASGAAQAGHLRRRAQARDRARRALRHRPRRQGHRARVAERDLWLALDFTLPEEAAFRGRQRFMFHCHNLEHEDGMMMRNLTVV